MVFLLQTSLKDKEAFDYLIHNKCYSVSTDHNILDSVRLRHEICFD